MTPDGNPHHINELSGSNVGENGIYEEYQKISDSPIKYDKILASKLVVIVIYFKDIF